MTPQPPSLAEQIDAVEWAELHAVAIAKRAIAKRGGLSAQTLRELRAGLEAAAETLRTMDFARETLR